MIIYPEERLSLSFSEVVADLNVSPKVGDDGHVDDHGRIATILFDVPVLDASLASAINQGGQWMLKTATSSSPDPSPVSWAEMREFVERPGVVAIAAMEHPLADGVTDHVTDSAEFDGLLVYMFASGIVGLTHAVADLAEQVNALKDAQA